MAESFITLPATYVRELAAATIASIDSERARRSARLVARVRASWPERLRTRLFGRRTDEQILEDHRSMMRVAGLGPAFLYGWGDRVVARRLYDLAMAVERRPAFVDGRVVNVTGDDWRVIAPAEASRG